MEHPKFIHNNPSPYNPNLFHLLSCQGSNHQPDLPWRQQPVCGVGPARAVLPRRGYVQPLHQDQAGQRMDCQASRGPSSGKT